MIILLFQVIHNYHQFFEFHFELNYFVDLFILHVVIHVIVFVKELIIMFTFRLSFFGNFLYFGGLVNLIRF